MKRKIPNILSMLRAIVAPLFFVLIISGKPNLILLSFIVFTFGAITDFFDGYLARKLKVTSEWGAFFDPLADKFLTTAAFIAFVFLKFIPLWMVVIIIIRDIGTTLFRVFKIGNRNLKTSSTAKMKTTLQMVFIFFVITLYTLTQYTGQSISSFLMSVLHSPIVYLAMLVITGMTVWSMVEYIFTMFRSEID